MQYYIEDDYYNLPESSLFVIKLINSIRKYAKKEQKPVLYSTSEVIYTNLANYLRSQNVSASTDVKKEAMLYTVLQLTDIQDSSKNFSKNVGDIFIIDDNNTISPINLKSIKRKLQKNGGDLHYLSRKGYFSSSLINFIDLEKDTFFISSVVFENISIIKKISLIFPYISPYMSIILNNSIEIQPFYKRNNYIELKEAKSPTSLKVVSINDGRGERIEYDVKDLVKKSNIEQNNQTEINNAHQILVALNSMNKKLDNILSRQLDSSGIDYSETLDTICTKINELIENEENRIGDPLRDFRCDNL